MEKDATEKLVSLDVNLPIWDRFFTVAPLVIIGTKEGDGYDLAPKHMITPMGHENYFGFVCTPRHQTYHNAKEYKAFTVSYPRPTQVVMTSLTAGPRNKTTGEKPIVSLLPTVPASVIDGVFLEDAYLCLECELDRIIDGFGDNSLITGRVVAAHVHPETLRVSEGDDQKLIYDVSIMAYLHPGRLATIRESVAFPMPAHMQH